MSESITIFGKNIDIKGDIIEEGTIDCSGKVCGNIFANVLNVKQNGKVKGKIFVNSLIVSNGGCILGDIVANNIKICKNSEITGNIKYNTISTEDGAKLNILCEYLESAEINNIIGEQINPSNVKKENNKKENNKKKTDKDDIKSKTI